MFSASNGRVSDDVSPQGPRFDPGLIRVRYVGHKLLCQKYEGRTESHEQQFFCKVTFFIIDKPNTPP